jgi:DNA-binding FrmR family transcriptional regulator
LIPIAEGFVRRLRTDLRTNRGDRLVVHEPKGLLGIDIEFSGQPHPGAQPDTHEPKRRLTIGGRAFLTIECVLDRRDCCSEMRNDFGRLGRSNRRQTTDLIRVDSSQATRQLGRAGQRRQVPGDAYEWIRITIVRTARGSPLLRLDRFPVENLIADRRRRRRIRENMWMTTNQLRGNRLGNPLEIEGSKLFSDPRLKDDLEEEIPELIAKALEITARDRLIDLIRLFDRMWRNARKVLLEIPGTAAIRVPEASHDLQQRLHSCHARSIGGSHRASPRAKLSLLSKISGRRSYNYLFLSYFFYTPPYGGGFMEISNMPTDAADSTVPLASSRPSDPSHAAAHAQAAPGVIRRLKSIEGHIRGVQKMVQADAYCIDILKQIKAIKQALERVGSITLETHLQTCVTEGLRSEDVEERERVIAEIVEVFNATGKL